MIHYSLKLIGEKTNHFIEHKSRSPKLLEKNILQSLCFIDLEDFCFKEC